MKYNALTQEETISARLRKAMTLRGIKAVEISQKTGISESAISHYLKGRYEPNQPRIALISNVLNVRPEWLMGLDVPMEDEEFYKAKNEAKVRQYVIKLLNLNKEDQEYIFKQIDLLERSKNESD